MRKEWLDRFEVIRYLTFDLVFGAAIEETAAIPISDRAVGKSVRRAVFGSDRKQ